MRYVEVLAVLLLLSTTVAGCSSTNFVIYPASEQGQNVSQVVRGGYTFLRSEKDESIVTVSLRRATESYVQTYVSVSNQGGRSVSVNPKNVTVKPDGGQQAFSAYGPEEAPTVVRRAAEGSRKSFLGMNSYNVTGDVAMGGEEGTAGSTGSYGTGGGNNSSTSYLDLMLKQQSLSGQQATSGLVFTPFSTGIEAFRMTVPVGNTTHTFQFSVRQGE